MHSRQTRRLDLQPRTDKVPAKALAKVLRFPVRHLAIGIPDCENETDAVCATLRFAGVLNKKGQPRERAGRVQIVQTGDLLLKRAPDPAVVRFWQRLGAKVAQGGGALHLVAGNHEMEIWRRLRAGERFGLSRPDLARLAAHIRSTKLFHLDGSTLYLHGYPTVAFLRDLERYCARTGRAPERYNRDRFAKALRDPKKLAAFDYAADGGRGLLHDVSSPRQYYRRHGKEVAGLLAGFGVATVVHGHRPERDGVQTDFELSLIHI